MVARNRKSKDKDKDKVMHKDTDKSVIEGEDKVVKGKNKDMGYKDEERDEVKNEMKARTRTRTKN